MKDVRALRSADFPPEEPLAPSICLTAWILHFQLNQVEDGSRALLNADLEAGHAAPCSAFSEFLTDSPGNLSHPRQSASALRENRTSVIFVWQSWTEFPSVRQNLFCNCSSSETYFASSVWSVYEEANWLLFLKWDNKLVNRVFIRLPTRKQKTPNFDVVFFALYCRHRKKHT